MRNLGMIDFDKSKSSSSGITYEVPQQIYRIDDLNFMETQVSENGDCLFNAVLVKFTTDEQTNELRRLTIERLGQLYRDNSDRGHVI